MENIVRGNLFEEFETPIKADNNSNKENGINKEQTLKVYLRVRPHLGISYRVYVFVLPMMNQSGQKVIQSRNILSDVVRLLLAIL